MTPRRRLHVHTRRRKLALLLAVMVLHAGGILLLPGSTPRQPPLMQEALQLQLQQAGQAQAVRQHPVNAIHKAVVSAAEAPIVPSMPVLAAPSAQDAPVVPVQTMPVQAVKETLITEPVIAGAKTPIDSGHAPIGTSGKTQPVVLNRNAAHCPGANVPPDYPSAAQRFGQQGVVTVQLLINTEGRIAEALVVQSSGYSLLDQSALEQIRRWRCQPATENGRPIPAAVKFNVEFRLNT